MGNFIEIRIEKQESDRKQNNFILMWNPSISSYTMDRFEEDLRDMADGFMPIDFNWSVWDHEQARDGDKFYMVKVGPGSNGIMMSGTFVSDPYQGEDWSGKGRTVFYMDMEIFDMIHPDRCPILSSERLAEEIHDFEWNGGHSGRILTEEQAEKVAILWDKFLEEHSYIFEPRAVKNY
jgi:hypothetical protein